MSTHIAVVCYGEIGIQAMLYLQQDSQLQKRAENRLRLSWKNLNHNEAQHSTIHTVNRADIVLIIGDTTAGQAASSALQIAAHCRAEATPCYALLAQPADSASQNAENRVLQQTVNNSLLITLTASDSTVVSSSAARHLADAALNILRPLGSDWLFNLDAVEIQHLLQTGVHRSFAKATSSNNNASEATTAALQLLPELNKAHFLLCNLNTHQDLPLDQLVQVNNLLQEQSRADCQIRQSCSLHPHIADDQAEVGITAVWPNLCRDQ